MGYFEPVQPHWSEVFVPEVLDVVDSNRKRGSTFVCNVALRCILVKVVRFPEILFNMAVNLSLCINLWSKRFARYN